MPPDRRRKLESTVAAIQQRHGTQAIRRARDLPHALPPYVRTGFGALDAITGCNGIPLGAITLFSGPGTSGKLTVAYKALANAQTPPHGENCVLLDLAHTTNPEYMQRCGVDLGRLLIVRPQNEADGLPLLLDLVQSRQTRLVLVDGIPELLAQRELARRFNAALGHLRQLARTASCAVLLVDESAPPWQRWLHLDAAASVRQNAALHVELRRERWLSQRGVMVGYSARAQVLRSLWRSDTPFAPVEITFNGAVCARPTW